MRTTQTLVASAALMVLMATGAAAQTAPYTEGSVWNLTFIRVKPAMGDRYLNDLRATIARQFAEAQRQGPAPPPPQPNPPHPPHPPPPPPPPPHPTPHPTP
jgi:hypothetical protein